MKPLRIECDWPPRELSPNSRVHHMVRYRKGKSYRNDCCIRTLLAAAGKKRAWRKTVHLTVTFRPPNKQRRDVDNMAATMKHGFDGIADALKVDDSRFELTLKRGEFIVGGQVVVEVT